MGTTSGRLCELNACERPVHGHGMCKPHWRRWKRHGDPQAGRRVLWGATVEERFWHKVDKDGPVPDHAPELGPCWLWTGALNRSGGYGQFVPALNEHVYAHRFAYVQVFGPIPEGMEVCHRCDRPECVRPEHLFAASHLENVRDTIRKGRRPEALRRPR